MEDTEVKEPEVLETEDNENVSEEQATSEESGTEEVSSEVTPESQGEPEKDEGWRKFAEERALKRQKIAEREEKERQKAEEFEAIKAALATPATTETQGMTQQEKQDIIDSLQGVDIPSGQEVESFVMNAIEKWDAKKSKEREAEKAKREQDSVGENIRRDHRDFDDVMSNENMDYLEYHYPEVAEALAAQSHSYSKWDRIYKTIKKLVPQSAKNDQARMEKNLSKPQAAAAGASQPTGDISVGRSLSDAERKENYKRLLALSRSA